MLDLEQLRRSVSARKKQAEKLSQEVPNHRAFVTTVLGILAIEDKSKIKRLMAGLAKLKSPYEAVVSAINEAMQCEELLKTMNFSEDTILKKMLNDTHTALSSLNNTLDTIYTLNSQVSTQDLTKTTASIQKKLSPSAIKTAIVYDSGVIVLSRAHLVSNANIDGIKYNTANITVVSVLDSNGETKFGYTIRHRALPFIGKFVEADRKEVIAAIARIKQ